MPARVHDGLVGKRELIGTAYLRDPVLRAQYAAEIAPRTEAQIQRIVLRLAFPESPRRILDIGAGTGAAGRALSQLFPEADITALDQVAAPGVQAFDMRRDLREVVGSSTFDLIVSAHAVGELVDRDPVQRAGLVANWMRHLSSGGRCLLIEPALRQTSRDLLALRDALVATHGVFVEAPCLWAGACPALERERDWCHDTAEMDGPERRMRADFSYLVLRALLRLPERQGAGSSEASGRVPLEGEPTAKGGQHPGDVFRIVSDLKREKGRLRLWGCGATGRFPLVLQSRDRCNNTEAFAQSQRGDLLAVGETRVAGDGLRISSASPVRRIPEPAKPEPTDPTI